MINYRRTLLKTFNPLSLTPMLMLDADNLLGTGTVDNPTNGSSVTSWIDLSGNSNNFSTGTAPTYSVAAMNGHNAVTFNGSTQFLTCANNASNAYTGGTSISVFAIASMATSATNNDMIITKGVFPAGGWGYGVAGATNNMNFTTFTVQQFNSTNLWTTAATFYIGTALYTNGTGVTFYKNAASSDAVSGVTSSAGYTGAMLLGQYGGVFFWNGSLNFLWVKYGTMTAAEIALMHGWCKARLGI